MSYWRIIRVQYRMSMWYRYKRFHDAPIEPFKVLFVSPKHVNYYSSRTGNKLHPVIKSGDWDTKQALFEQGVVYKSFCDRFVKNHSWSRTELYDRYLEQYGSEKEALNNSEKLDESFYKESSELEAALGKYDYIFQQIKNDGYKLQQDIRSIDDRLANPGLLSSAVPVLDEITVDIARDGTMLCYCGQHRLAIAKILELQSIPVRIRLRHQKWQYKRDEVWKGKQAKKEHPDLISV